MSSIKLRNLKRILAFLMAMALVFAYSPVIGAESVEIYHETFANGTGIAAQSGGASLTQVSGKTFDGNSDGKALYVSKRTNNWDAADFKFTDLKLENGKTYSITVKGYVDSGVNIPSGAQAALQTADGYAWISGVNMEAGKAFTLTGTYKVGSNEKDTRFRVQSDEKGKTVPFYIGDIVITTDKAAAASTGASSGAAASAGTGASVSAPAAKEIYHETFASGVGAAKQSGGASLAQVTGKTFDGNSDGKALYVSKRTNNWDAADFNFTDVGMKDGKTYNITVKGYIDSDATIPTGAQAALQTADGYAWISGVNMEAGKAFTLTGKYTVGSNKSDTRLRIQSNDAGKAVSFYVGDIAITEDASSTGTSTTGSGNAASTAEKFTTITFEDQKADGFVGRAGTEKLTVTKEANHTDGGAYALKVEGRKETWHGPAMRVEKYVDQGSEYKITAWVKLIDPASSQLQLSTQVGDGSGASYNNLNAKAVSSSDGWVELTGTFRYNNTSSNFITIYVESPSSATASYYIDDISFENTGSAPISIQKDLKAIKDAYKNSFLIGNAISAEDLEGIRLEMLKKHFNVVTAGNAMKPDALQNVKGKFTFDAADKMIKQAADAGLKVHGHVLAWHQQSPAWLNTKTDAKGNTVKLSRTEALANLRTHIKTVMEHFGNKVISWDVVNEAMNDNPSNPADYKASLRKTPWYDAIGPDYVEQAFLAAREVLDKHPSWKIRLYYNDYNEDNQNKATAIYNMVKDINARYARTHHGKLLIDGIGMQAHYSISTNPTNVELSLKKFISLGVKVSITELDIMTGNNYELSDQLATAQGYLYAELLKLFKANAKYIERVTFWGADDGTSWRSSQNPTPFDKNLQAKPAYYGVIDPDKFMAENKPAAAEGAKQSTAKFGTPVIDGKIDVVWKNAPELPINRYQMAWQGASGTAKVLWDNKYLYVLYQVNDAQLDKKSANPWEQDSVEAFLDENNGKTTFYQGDDGQYRVNYSNTTSFNPASISKNFKSATKVSGTNYVVEMRIPFKTVKPKANMKIGFDAQINDGKDGARQSVATWNDTTGNAYQDTSVYGVITLKK